MKSIKNYIKKKYNSIKNIQAFIKMKNIKNNIKKKNNYIKTIQASIKMKHIKNVWYPKKVLSTEFLFIDNKLIIYS